MALSLSYVNQAMDEPAVKITQEQANRMLLRAHTIEEAQAALNAGAHLNPRNGLGHTALISATGRGHENIVQLLLNEGANVNERSKYGYTALMEAAIHNNTNIVHLLLNTGADVNAQCSYGDTALIYAAGNEHENIVRILLNAGANVNAQNNHGYTPLIRAVNNNERENIVRLLLDAGADVNAQNNNGATALDDAVLYNKVHLVSIFLDWATLDTQTVQDALDKIQIARNDTTNIYGKYYAMKVSPEIIQALQNYLDPHPDYILK